MQSIWPKYLTRICVRLHVVFSVVLKYALLAIPNLLQTKNEMKLRAAHTKVKRRKMKIISGF